MFGGISSFDWVPWATVCVSIAAHGTVFTLFHAYLSRRLFGGLYTRLNKREQMRFDERLVSACHACVSAQGSMRAFFQMLPRPLTLQGIADVSGSFAFVVALVLTPHAP